MSFRGFYQVVCIKGHYSEVDCYEFSFSSWRCEVCGEKHYKAVLVDQTNDAGVKENKTELINEALLNYKPK